VQQSHQVPVLVDFWATWCGPCRALGPILERLAVEYDGAFVLAKIDTDAEQALAAQFQIRSIPTVMLFRDGVSVGGFPGALPEGQIRRFLADHGVHGVRVRTVWSDDPATRVAELRAAVGAAPARGDLQLELATALIDTHAHDDARHVLDSLPSDVFSDPAALRMRAMVQLHQQTAHAPSLEALQARLALVPTDAEAMQWLGMRLALGGDTARAVELLLEAVRAQKGSEELPARDALVQVLQLIDDDALVRDARRRLASALF
jgi:putative thioredoxin